MTLRSFFLSIFDGKPKEEYDIILKKYTDLELELDRLSELEIQEEYIVNKYPTVEKLYGARPIPPSLQERSLVDPRIFFTPYDSKVIKIAKALFMEGMDDDKKVYEAFLWVRKNIKYKYDKDNFGTPEFWSFPFETLARKAGDCDSQSILLANICLAMGVPYYKLRLTVGPVEGGNHCFLTYYVESKSNWVIMDATYWPNAKIPSERPNYKDETKYFDEVWFSWDQKHVYQKGTKNWIK